MKRYPRIRSHSHRQRRGTTSVEFALVAPIFFLFLFGLMELAMLSRVSSMTELAILRGARAVSKVGSSAAMVKSEVQEMLDRTDIKDYQIQVSPALFRKGDKVRIRVTVPMTLSNKLVLSSLRSTPLVFDQTYRCNSWDQNDI